MNNEHAKLTFNFVGDAVAAKPSSINEDLQFRASLTPNYGDTIAFEGTSTVFLVHSRHFAVRASGLVDVTLNLIVAKSAQ